MFSLFILKFFIAFSKKITGFLSTNAQIQKNLQKKQLVVLVEMAVFHYNYRRYILHDIFWLDIELAIGGQVDAKR